MNLPSKNHLTESEKTAFSKIYSLGQEEILKHWESLSVSQKHSLIDQILKLDVELFERQKATLNFLQTPLERSIKPYQGAHKADLAQKEAGKKLVQQNKGAVGVLAGGQGSRLRYQGPKGKYPVTLFKKKSLFQLLAEKVKAARLQTGTPLEIAIMTSPLNHKETQDFFVDNAFFGLDPSAITFFAQEMWPLLNEEKNFFLDDVADLARGPNGNGSFYKRFVAEGLWQDWTEKGVEMVQVLSIDNPLALPFEPTLFAFHQFHEAQITVVCAKKNDPAENVGVLAEVNQQVGMVEYTELSSKERTARNEHNELLFGLGNLSMYCFSMPFILQVSREELPMHLAKKAARVLTEDGKILFPEKPNAWKFEEFIFDALLFAKRVAALETQREFSFAPLKNLKGDDSIDSLHRALLNFDRDTFLRISGKSAPPNVDFELDPQFYYPTDQLLEKWRGKTLPNAGYIYE